MQIRVSLIPALGLNDDSLMGMSSLLRVTCDNGSACGAGDTEQSQWKHVSQEANAK